MKGYEQIKKLLESELSDYSFEYEIELDKNYEQTDKDEYYEVVVKWTYRDNKQKTLCFHYNIDEDKIEIELGEDSFYEVKDYDWQIKYFWMALLEW